MNVRWAGCTSRRCRTFRTPPSPTGLLGISAHYTDSTDKQYSVKQQSAEEIRTCWRAESLEDYTSKTRYKEVFTATIVTAICQEQSTKCQYIGTSVWDAGFMLASAAEAETILTTMRQMSSPTSWPHPFHAGSPSAADSEKDQRMESIRLTFTFQM